ncbi:MAG: amidohydrolase [Stomatobaculum sp.]|nr:amidohydrolase [Stomatobaculum sp.]
MNYKIINGTLLLDDGASVTLKKGEEIYVRDGKISFMPGSPLQENGEEPWEVVDAQNRLVMPGLINMHTHVYMTFMRSYADDVPFMDWLFKGVMPVEDRMDAETAYWSNLLGFAEMIRTGTTCFYDMHMFCGQSPRAAAEAGMRGVIGRSVVGEDLYRDGFSRFQQMMSEKEEYEGGLLRFAFTPHAIYTCSQKLLGQVIEKAGELSLLKQIHLSESVTEVEDCLKKYGVTPVRLLHDIGFLDEKTSLAHCVQMREGDIELIRESGAAVVTNPASNAKLGNGFAPVGDFLRAGVNVCIGTDGTASNNTLNMFREMGLLSLIHKGVERDPSALPAVAVLRAATTNAAKALQMEGRLGVLKEGAEADLIFLDLDEISLFPDNNLVSSLCYCANGSEVASVMIGGKFVMREREMLTIDMEKVRFHIRKAAEKYLR